MPSKLAVLGLLLLCGSRSVPAHEPSANERFLFDAVNHERLNRELPPLRWDSTLADAARAHARRMAGADSLSHQLPGEPDLVARVKDAGTHFSRVAENVARGVEAEDLHAGWMQSPGHRRNILDPQLNALGIAVVEKRGVLFAVQDFAHAVPRLSLEQQEQEVGRLLRAYGLTIRGNTEDARKTCRSAEAYFGPAPVSIFRFDAPELDRLPERLEQKLKGGGYRSAAVGACINGEDRFTGFRIALLLY